MSDSIQPECWCEWVDIGVGMQRVAEHPECPRHVEPMPPEGTPVDETAENQS